jgi:hypothetical protein
VVVFLAQLVGYAALSAVVPHSDFATTLEPLQRLPTVVLVVVALLGIPAVLLAVGLGVVLQAVGVRPTGALVLLSAGAISVGLSRVYRWSRGHL